MNSREALEELKCVLETNFGTKKYADIFAEHLLKPIKEDLDILEILKDLIFTDRCEILYTEDKQYITLQFIGTDYEEQARIDEKQYKQIELIKEWLEK